VFGRQPGAHDKELQLIDDCLVGLATVALGVDVKNSSDLDQLLNELSLKASSLLGTNWPGNVVVRPVHRSSYVSKATSKKAVEKFMAALSLLHAGAVREPTGNRVNIRELLVAAPLMRFDCKGLTRT